MYQSINEPAGSLERIHQNFDMICLVDDDPGSTFLHTYFLNDIGYNGTLKQFNDPLKALDKINHWTEQSSILVLLDLNMPQCTGWQFIEAVQSDWNSDHIDNIKICVLSSSMHPTDLQKAEESCLVKLYSEKPTDTAAMASIIDRLVHSFDIES